ncbi:DUF4179 domain-containing protein [Lysinibacillus sp. NPDC097287]|uniref:DUF4179 domain-containing protein n=1 Tax=Lysinibacillus sp. NPDC097287 TaxID=3364144 RepID=UPI00380C1845
MFGDTRQIEDKPIEIGVRKKLQKRWFVVAMCILIVGGVLITKIPFVEGIIGEKTAVNFDDYKTEVGHTTENNFGKLTLNEVVVDDNQLLLNATFVPEDGTSFDHQIFFFPQVLVNGQDYTVRNRGQSIEQLKSKYTIYSSIQVSELPQENTLTLDISYNKWNLEQPIDQPWDFHVDASQKKVLADKKIISVNETVTLTNGNEVKVTKVVSTPISTTIYYHLAEKLSETVSFKIKTASGKTWRWNSGFTLDEEVDALSVNRFDALYLTEDKYYLIPIGADDRELGPSIQIGK